jgi:hypothetical protein
MMVMTIMPAMVKEVIKVDKQRTDARRELKSSTLCFQFQVFTRSWLKVSPVETQQFGV